MASWNRPPPVKGERLVQFVKRESMWSIQQRLVQNKPVSTCDEMDPTVGPMLKDKAGNVIIYDYFIRGGYFYLISVYWSEASPRLSVLVNDIVPKESGYQEYMSTRYFVTPMPDTGLVWVTINGVVYELMPDVIKGAGRKHKFGIVLNFKFESSAWIRRFLDYYKKQGADAFYFYYNGPVLPDDLPTGPNIFYKTWDCPFKIFSKRFIHSAQTVAYCAFRWRHYDDCEWVAAIDFDEFIYDMYEKNSVVDVLARMDCDVVMLNNFWATIAPNGAINYSMNSCGFNFDNGRTKCIFNTRKYRGTWGIHLPKDDCNMIKSRRLVFFHVIDCLHPERSDLLVPPLRSTKVKVAALTG